MGDCRSAFQRVHDPHEARDDADPHGFGHVGSEPAEDDKGGLAVQVVDADALRGGAPATRDFLDFHAKSGRNGGAGSARANPRICGRGEGADHVVAKGPVDHRADVHRLGQLRPLGQVEIPDPVPGVVAVELPAVDGVELGEDGAHRFALLQAIATIRSATRAVAVTSISALMLIALRSQSPPRLRGAGACVGSR